MASPLLLVEGLSVTLPDGRALLRDLAFSVSPGEVVAILGGSGSGKSTLARALFEPELLRERGFALSFRRVELGTAALVPQRGAPFDHLDVRGNVALPLAWRRAKSRAAAGDARPDSPDLPGGVDGWLALVGLPPELAKPGWKVSRLSGGQAQRLAVARALAAGRSLLFLDEPSAGLDLRSSRELARLLRDRAAAESTGIVLVTHDTRLAAEAADRKLFLDPESGGLVPLDSPPGDAAALETELDRRLDEAEGTTLPPGRRGFDRFAQGIARLWRRSFGPMQLPAIALLQLLRVTPRRVPHIGRVALRVLRQALVRPALFYAIVSLLLGFTILYVLVRSVPEGLSPVAVLDLVGGSHVLALTPPLAALLFVATSGSAVAAWLGSMSLTKQVTALRALGVRVETYLWLPAFLAMTVAFLLSAAIVAAGMIAGGALLYGLEKVPGGFWEVAGKLAADLVDPPPERQDLRTRAAALLLLYAPGIAADVVYRGTRPKETGDEVTSGMTGSVIASTLWVVVLELISALILFAAE